MRKRKAEDSATGTSVGDHDQTGGKPASYVRETRGRRMEHAMIIFNTCNQHRAYVIPLEEMDPVVLSLLECRNCRTMRISDDSDDNDKLLYAILSADDGPYRMYRIETDKESMATYVSQYVDERIYNITYL